MKVIPTNECKFDVTQTKQPNTTFEVSTMQHPFVEGIMEVHLLMIWKNMTFEKYDESTYPDKHIDIYQLEHS